MTWAILESSSAGDLLHNIVQGQARIKGPTEGLLSYVSTQNITPVNFSEKEWFTFICLYNLTKEE